MLLTGLPQSKADRVRNPQPVASTQDAGTTSFVYTNESTSAVGADVGLNALVSWLPSVNLATNSSDKIEVRVQLLGGHLLGISNLRTVASVADHSFSGPALDKWTTCRETHRVAHF